MTRHRLAGRCRPLASCSWRARSSSCAQPEHHTTANTICEPAVDALFGIVYLTFQTALITLLPSNCGAFTAVFDEYTADPQVGAAV